MSEINKNLVEKFMQNKTSAEENEIIFEWFGTPEGEKFLEEQLDDDIVQFLKGNNYLTGGDVQPDSGKIFSSVQRRIRVTPKHEISAKKDKILPFLKAAAVILVVLVNALLYQFVFKSSEIAEEIVETTPLHYASPEGQQLKITLRDKSIIQLNSNSEIWIQGDNSDGSRTVKLSGEAYFEVMSDPDRSFRIQANESVVEVLGTVFNVKSYDFEDNVQVAVLEGRVAFKNEKTADQESSSVVLQAGNFAYLDFNSNQITVEDFGVENYLSWMRGRLVFDELSLDRVCLQLSRLYMVQCEFNETDLQDLKLTSDFTDDSLEKTLSVIGLTLGIEHRFDNDNIVVWHR